VHYHVKNIILFTIASLSNNKATGLCPIEFIIKTKNTNYFCVLVYAASIFFPFFAYSRLFEQKKKVKNTCISTSTN